MMSRKVYRHATRKRQVFQCTGGYCFVQYFVSLCIHELAKSMTDTERPLDSCAVWVRLKAFLDVQCISQWVNLAEYPPQLTSQSFCHLVKFGRLSLIQQLQHNRFSQFNLQFKSNLFIFTGC